MEDIGWGSWIGDTVGDIIKCENAARSLRKEKRSSRKGEAKTSKQQKNQPTAANGSTFLQATSVFCSITDSAITTRLVQ